MQHAHAGAICQVVFAIVAVNLGTASAQTEAPYDCTQSTDYRNLDGASRTKLHQAIDDLASLASALDSFMSDHRGQPPQSLDELVPVYIASLPMDPFAGSAVSADGKWKQSLGGSGYLYQRRKGPAYEVSWSPEFAIHTLDGTWKIKSIGLPNFPLRYRSKNGRGLIRTRGYWGRMTFDVF